MKKRIKKTIALLTLTVAVLGTSMTAMAASCLSVRDYKHHKFDHRFVSEVQHKVVFTGVDGKRYLETTTFTTGYCVCGLRGTVLDVQVDRIQ